MNIIVGKKAGFCGGVINSVSNTKTLLKDRNNIYCLGELVHNKQVVDDLINDGLILVESLEEVPDDSEVIIRAHGVSEEVYKQAKNRNIKLFDYTCPNVLKIHDDVINLVKDKYFIILIAQKVHPEAIGTISFCKDGIIVESEDDIKNVLNSLVKSGLSRVAIISQTTFSLKKFEQLSLLLQDLLVDYDVMIKNTICPATELRQKETDELSRKVDAMIIIGGKNSSNTKKLYEISKNNCLNSFVIETVKAIYDLDFSSFNIVGVMAGASTPKRSIDEVIEYLSSGDVYEK